MSAAGCSSEPESGAVSVGEQSDAGTSSSPRARPSVQPRGSAAGSRSDGAEAGESCSTDADCVFGASCFQGTCVGEGALRFSLSWRLDTDLDLHVLTPSGTEIYFANPRAGGGELDVDDCIGSMCRQPGGTHVENIYWDAAPPSGEYVFWAHNFSGELAADFQIEVSADDSIVASEAGSVPVVAPFESTRFTYVH